MTPTGSRDDEGKDNPEPMSQPPPTTTIFLVELASQHHASEYNRLKFGPQGCPTKYLPLSLHLPDFFAQLRRRQMACVPSEPWSRSPPSSSYVPPIRLGPRGAAPGDSYAHRLEEDLRAALYATIDIVPRCAIAEFRLLRDPAIKTSTTHPINISPIIPPSLLSVISAHLAVSPRRFPTFFSVPRAFVLPSLVPASPYVPQDSPSTHPRRIITDALQAAIHRRFSHRPRTHHHLKRNTTLPLSSPPLDSPQTSTSIQFSMSITVPASMPCVILQDPEKAHCPPPSTLAIPLGNLFLSSCPGKKVRLDGPVKGRTGVCRDLDVDLKRIKALGVGCVICCLDNDELDFLGAPWSKYEELAGRIGIDILRLPIPEGLAPLTPASLDNHLTQVINTYTLEGIPVLVHCRGGVGRAGVIACCWLIRLGLCGWVKQDNRSSANDCQPLEMSKSSYINGVMNECNARKVTASANGTVNRIFRGHTDGGTAFHIPSPSSPAANPGSKILPVALDLRPDTVELVENVISIVRKRRSMKAIETYEQVRFLVDFVEHLRQGDQEPQPLPSV